MLVSVALGCSDGWNLDLEVLDQGGGCTSSKMYGSSEDGYAGKHRAVVMNSVDGVRLVVSFML